ncbi:MAG: SgcJ/EcaC family oxidoreductase [Armatimonadetes bacterium]|nr:SgcJ/EcaC family oxidoreductase [Armatimonadota bacterium]
MTTEYTQASAGRLAQSDGEAIHHIVARFVAAWNDGDSAAIAALFAEEADFINVLGAHDRGRASIEASHRFIFDTIYRGSRNRYTVETIRFIRPDVAVAFLRAHLTFHAGERTGEIHARPTMVLAKEGADWRIVVFQNTKIAAPEARSGADL